MGRIAGLLSLEVEDQNDSLDALHHVGSELAMHVVAAKPLFLTKEAVSSEAMESEREILRSQVSSIVIKLFSFDISLEKFRGHSEVAKSFSLDILMKVVGVVN